MKTPVHVHNLGLLLVSMLNNHHALDGGVLNRKDVLDLMYGRSRMTRRGGGGYTYTWYLVVHTKSTKIYANGAT